MSLELLDTVPAAPTSSDTVRPRAHAAESPATLLRRTGVRLGVQSAVVGAVLALLGLPVLFGTFRFYDDEGYFLVSLRSFAEGSPLYDRVFTQYGPLYYQVEWVIFSALGLPFTNAAARWVVLGTWTLTAALCGIAAFRATRSFLAALAAEVLTFAVLTVLADEPLHPAGLTCLIVSAAACLLSGRPEGGLVACRWVAAAALSGALLAIKVNVGVFSALAMASAAAVFAGGDGPLSRTCRLGVRWLLPVVPFLLVRDRLSEPSVVLHAASVALALGLVSVELRGRGPAATIAPGSLAITGCALAAVPAASFAAALLLGTSPAGLLRGVLLDPIRCSAAFAVLLDPDPAFAVAAATSTALLLVRVRARSPEREAAVRRALDVATLAVSFVTIASFAGLLPFKPIYATIPFLWLFLPDGSAGRRGTGALRAALVLMAAMHALHPYPVAGSQIAFGTFLLVPLMVSGALSSAQSLFGDGRARRDVIDLRTAASAALALSVVAGLYPEFPRAHAAWAAGTPLGLPGTEGMRLPERQTAHLRWLVANLRTHADVFASAPGLNSLYLWTGLRPPTDRNTTVWLVLLDAHDQEGVARALRGAARPCVVIDRRFAAEWREVALWGSSPLATHLFTEYEVAGSTPEHEILVRKGRAVEVVECATVVAAPGAGEDPEAGGDPSAAGTTETSAGRGSALRIRLEPAPGRRLARVDLVVPETGAVLASSEVRGDMARATSSWGEETSNSAAAPNKARSAALAASGGVTAHAELAAEPPGSAPAGISLDGPIALDLRLQFPVKEGGLEGALRRAGIQELGLCLVRLIDPQGQRIAAVPVVGP